jgi:hypothetical protein
MFPPVESSAIASQKQKVPNATVQLVMPFLKNLSLAFRRPQLCFVVRNKLDDGSREFHFIWVASRLAYHFS